ncbi:MAG: OmpA family protein [Paludibacter sp.]|nr:OmpA family protein [Paludibacter sp.]
MKTKFILLLITGYLLSTGFALSQLNIGNRIKNATNNRVNKEVDQGVNKGINSVIDGVLKKKKITKNDSINATESSKSISTSTDSKTPPLLVSSKYDFIPGEKVIFFDDFSQDNVGDFPALWNTNGSAEVVTTNLFPGHWMKYNCREAIWTDELLKLPDNYTIEFDLIPIQGNDQGMAGYDFRLLQAKNVKAYDHGSAPGNGGFLFSVEYFGRPSYHTWFIKDGCQELQVSGSKDDDAVKQKENQKYHIAIWIQKSRIRLYQDQNKLFDLPKAIPVDCIKMDRIRFEEGAAMVSNIRIAIGNPDMRSKLMTEGKLVSYGIYFDINKDIVKPESFGTLKGIADVLKENPEAKVKIVGHTDSDGADAANLDLSKRRGASVKDALVKTFGIEASRLESDGLGETKPIAPNDNPVNKALNRRVEFIKL